ncbi:MAG: metallophosphoesterase family protein [Candidatus Omnitrophica bacterium]|nr:metallophosphoesterase family protein [Candidatus Omnitrophota bacterium]
MKILVISDTHIPRTSHDMPEAVYKAIEGVDMIIHAGDFVEKDFYDKLKGLRELKGVCGYMDSAELRRILKPKEIIEVGNFKLGLIHGYGAPANLLDTVRSEFNKDVSAVIFGHSHAALNVVKDGVLFFNPGSPTDKIFAASNSYGILEVTDKKIEGKIIEL